ncbi:MAG: 4-hydroxy-3-methylbut-2-enyl diphosphate reductase, partial [Sediminibacterium sp.]|nr:4-hydroxy-3-methylbut-2-enyl diphosphate reductase [Sediminibacterium sp.]
MKTFNVPNFYKSEILTNLKNNRKKLDPLKKDFSPYTLQFDGLEIIIARHFGFCYGVENAIEIAFSAIENEKGKRIFLLSEMIHNPNVNADLIDAGIQFLQDTKGNQLIPFDILTPEDIVLIPAFGTTIEIEEILQKQGVQFKKYNTTCPFVEKVWNRSEQIARNGFTLIIHGKPTHEETRATFSHINRHTKAIIVNDIMEARLLGDLILTNKNVAEIENKFKNRVSENFDFIHDLKKIGVVNQTTQLSTETLFISNYFKEIMNEKYGELEIKNHFADTKDTLCYATNDNQ